MRKIIVSAVSFLIVTAPASAITWSKQTVADPFARGAKCHVAEPVSFGSYIYSYPEKWDGVYWPHTDENWLWRCEKSGYVAFGSEFNDIDAEQKLAVAAWLKANGKVDKGIEGSLQRIEALEQFRRRKPIDAAWFKRLMARWRNESDPTQADQYRRDSIPLMITALETANPTDAIQLHFLLGVYAEKFEGAVAADPWFARAREAKWTDDDGKEQTGMPYFNEMIDELIGRRIAKSAPE